MNNSNHWKKLTFLSVFLLILTATLNLAADPVYTEDFESGTFEDWHVVNDQQTNQWYTGAVGAANGNYGAFVSEDGTNAAYNTSSPSVVFFYRDINIPEDAVLLNLSFAWKGMGEVTSWDWGRVYWTTPDIVPEAGAILDPDYAVSGYLNNQSTFTTLNIPLPLTEGQTAMRLVFGWRNDGSVGSGDPVCIDDIVISYQSNDDPPFAVNLISPADGANNIFKNGVLEWEVSAGATDYKLYFGSDGGGTESPTSIENGTSLGETTTYNFSDLEWMQTYYWQVVPSNEAGEAENCPIWSFTTIENPVITPPHMQDFENYPPVNWTEGKGLLANPTEFTSESSSWTADGFGNVGTSGSARINIWSTHVKDWMFSPYFDLGDNSVSYRLEFDLALTPYSGSVQTSLGEDDKFALLIQNEYENEWSEENIVELWNSESQIPPTGVHQSIDLSDYTGIVKFAFYGESTVSNNDVNMYVDNFAVIAQTDEPQLVVNISNIAFPPTGIGGTEYFAFALNNSGGSDLVISDVQLSSPFYADFPEVIEAFESETVFISFSPEEEGDFSDTLVIQSNSITGEVSIPVSGSGYEPLDGDLFMNAYEVNFDGVEYTDEGNTTEYNNDYDLPGSDGKDVVYKLILENDYVTTISLLGSEYDTKLAIYEDHSDVPGWTPGPDNYIGYNDDYYRNNNLLMKTAPKEQRNSRDLQSQVTDLALQAGSYFVIVDGYGSSCGDYDLSITGTETTLSSLSGIVTDEDTGEPVVGASVFLNGSSSAAITDTAGYYQLNSIPGGSYVVMATAANYYNYISPDSVEIEEDTVYDISLSHHLFSVVTGTVTNSETNEPVEGVVVNYGGEYSASTDENGYYHYSAVLRNTYQVTASKLHYFNYISPEEVEVYEDSVNYNFEMEPHHYGIISGNVINQDNGEAVAQAKVIINGIQYAADENGHYESAELLYGTYDIYCMGLDFDTNYSVGSVVVDSMEITQDFSMHPNPDNGNEPTTATPLYGPTNGAIYSIFDADDSDWFVFYAAEGTDLFMYTERYQLSTLDARFYFYGPNAIDGSDVDLGGYIAQNDDSHGNLQPEISYNVDAGGFYFLRVSYFANYPRSRSTNFGDYKLFIEGEISFAAPPQNLLAEVEMFNVNLSWEQPQRNSRQILRKSRNSGTSNREVTGYKIFRDNEDTPIATIPANQLTYIDEMVPPGTHVYWVKAVHNGTSDSPASNEQEVTVEAMMPPYGLDLSTNLDSVFMEWSFSRSNNFTRNNSGRAVRLTREVTGFKIYRNNTLLDYLEDPEARSYIDTGLEQGDYEYYVTAIYYGEYESVHSNTEDIYVQGSDGKEDNIIPLITEMKGNYPNPFNPETSIEFSVNKDDDVTLIIYNAKGQLVKVIVDEFMKAGNYQVTWKGKDFQNREVASGIYFCSMQTSDYKNIKKMMLLK